LHRWTAGRIVALVAGSVVVLASAGIGLGGGALAIADHGLRDHDGFLMSGTTELTAGGYAIATTSVTLDADVPSAFLTEDLLGNIKVTATADQPVFLGIARTSDAKAYLRGVDHATLTDFADHPVYENSSGGAPQTLPTASDIWVAKVTGTGTQELIWPARSGEWTLVMMNADGSPGVTAQAKAGATVPALDWIVPTLLVTAAVGLALGILLLVLALRSGRTPTPTSGV
jgi:hypothetical protein